MNKTTYEYTSIHVYVKSTLEIVIDLPFGFPINNIISLSKINLVDINIHHYKSNVTTPAKIEPNSQHGTHNFAVNCTHTSRSAASLTQDSKSACEFVLGTSDHSACLEKHSVLMMGSAWSRMLRKP